MVQLNHKRVLFKRVSIGCVRQISEKACVRAVPLL